MHGVEKKAFASPDERRSPAKTDMEIVNVGAVKAARLTLQPGWRWSECIKPIAKTDSCQVHHVGMVTAGKMHVRHNDGSEIDLAPGDAYVIEPGHDAWVVGSEQFVGYEFDNKAAATFAKR
ncbi:MAG: cupin domain-containing protein [Deltaproteobacteria bacterium]|nr:cupin domain-containing protein [Deltaproteobacteria bacterium]